MKIWICVVFFVFSIFWVIFIDIVVYCVVIYGIWMIYIGIGIFIYVWKKIFFDNYKCFLYIFVYWENDVKKIVIIIWIIWIWMVVFCIFLIIRIFVVFDCIYICSILVVSVFS